jgi:hypothetical protein
MKIKMALIQKSITTVILICTSLIIMSLSLGVYVDVIYEEITPEFKDNLFLSLPGELNYINPIDDNNIIVVRIIRDDLIPDNEIISVSMHKFSGEIIWEQNSSHFSYHYHRYETLGFTNHNGLIHIFIRLFVYSFLHTNQLPQLLIVSENDIDQISKDFSGFYNYFSYQSKFFYFQANQFNITLHIFDNGIFLSSMLIYYSDRPMSYYPHHKDVENFVILINLGTSPNQDPPEFHHLIKFNVNETGFSHNIEEIPIEEKDKILTSIIRQSNTFELEIFDEICYCTLSTESEPLHNLYRIHLIDYDNSNNKSSVYLELIVDTPDILFYGVNTEMYIKSTVLSKNKVLIPIRKNSFNEFIHSEPVFHENIFALQITTFKSEIFYEFLRIELSIPLNETTSIINHPLQKISDTELIFYRVIRELSGNEYSEIFFLQYYDKNFYYELIVNSLIYVLPISLCILILFFIIKKQKLRKINQNVNTELYMTYKED